MKISNILYTYEDKTRWWPRGNGCSVHVLKGPLKTVMVDTGQMIGGFHRYLAAGMRQDGLSLADIDEIWLTHPHIDHINAVPAVQQASGAAVYCHPSGLSFLTSSVRTFAGEMLAAAGEDVHLPFRFKPEIIDEVDLGFYYNSAGQGLAIDTKLSYHELRNVIGTRTVANPDGDNFEQA